MLRDLEGNRSRIKKKKTWVRMMEPPHNIPSPESQELVLPHPREKSVFKVGGGLKDI